MGAETIEYLVSSRGTHKHTHKALPLETERGENKSRRLKEKIGKERERDDNAAAVTVYV